MKKLDLQRPHKRSLHGRTGFEDTTAQEEKRWVQRMNLNTGSATTKELSER